MCNSLGPRLQIRLMARCFDVRLCLVPRMSYTVPKLMKRRILAPSHQIQGPIMKAQIIFQVMDFKLKQASCNRWQTNGHSMLERYRQNDKRAK